VGLARYLVDRTAKPGEGLAVRFDPVSIGTNELTADRSDYGSICLRSCLNGHFSSAGFVKLTDYRPFSTFLHEAKPLKFHITAISELPRICSESG